VAAAVLDPRALNRATLARQLLLERDRLAPLDAVGRLVGLQAQVPRDPYVALWSRLDGFRPEQLSALLEERRVVRTVAMRGTIHLLTADDALAIRPLVQPVLDAELVRHPEHGPRLRGVDLSAALAAGRDLLADRPLTTTELRAALAERFPELDAPAAAYACRCLLALVQVPPRGLWGRSGTVRLTPLEAWVGRSLDAAASLDDLVRRYLAAFGPATVADVAAWSRLTGLRPVLERLRHELVTFRDERGRELFDLPDAPRPDPETPAPPRFLPEYDNVVLSHADRGRFAFGGMRVGFGTVEGLGHGGVLHDGRFVGLWRVEEGALVVRHPVPLAPAARSELATEGRRLLAFLGADGSGVRFVRLR
jgi:hypothetical protein